MSNKDPYGLYKARRDIDQISAEPIFLPDRGSTKIAVVWDKALRVFNKDLQIASATKHTESFGQTTAIFVEIF